MENENSSLPPGMSIPPQPSPPAPTPPVEDKPDRDDWSHRRHRLDAMTVLFGSWLSYIIWKDNPDPLYTSVAFYLIVGLVTILGTYIVGSLYDYKSYLDANRRF